VHPFDFGGPLQEFADPATNVMTSPRCYGKGALDGPDLEFLKHRANQLILNFASQTLAENATGSLLAIDSVLFGRAVEATINAELSAEGSSVQIMELHLNFTEEDQAAMMSSALVPGARVLATWSDGRTFPATVRSFNGSMYEVVWVGGQGSAWVPASAVRAV